MSTADEVLAVLKSDTGKDLDKKKDLEVLVGKMDSEFFTDLMTIANNVPSSFRLRIIHLIRRSTTPIVMKKN